MDQAIKDIVAMGEIHKSAFYKRKYFRFSRILNGENNIHLGIIGPIPWCKLGLSFGNDNSIKELQYCYENGGNLSCKFDDNIVVDFKKDIDGNKVLDINRCSDGKKILENQKINPYKPLNMTCSADLELIEKFLIQSDKLKTST